jgi:hypothetical protein
MKLVMTLLVRDEADIVDAQIAFHLGVGVDFVIATDNRSEDRTTEILERYERQGVLHLIREDGDDLRQSEWVTRMARLAATEFGADWVINSDGDEFWLPRAGSFREILEAVPDRFGLVRGAWRNFVPRPEGESWFAERMTVRLCATTYLDVPMATVLKSVHRATPDVRVGRGNHEAFGDGLIPLRGWYPIEILHFPIRSREQCRRKYVTQYLTLERNPDKGTPAPIVEGYNADRDGRFDEFYDPLIVDDGKLERLLADGDVVVDTRLRDILRGLGQGSRPVLRRSPLEDEALFAAEVSVIPDSDLASVLEERVVDLEAGIVRLERRSVRARGRALGRRLAR